MTIANENTPESIDAVTTALIRSSIKAVTDDMFAAMQRLAMSSVIHEMLDFGVALLNEKGELISGRVGTPTMLGMFEASVSAIIEKYASTGEVEDGDIFVLNTPHYGGASHVNDIITICPVYSGATLIGWLANKAHFLDLGGAFPGGINPTAMDIFQEGLQIPGVKVIEHGILNRAVLDIILANSRLPEVTKADFWASVSAVRVGQKRLISAVKKYSRQTLCQALVEYVDEGEQRALAAMDALPKGVFTVNERLGDDRLVKLSVTISDDQFIVDLRGNPQQSATAMNASRDASFADCQMFFKAITCPDDFSNAGSFRPVSMLADHGSMFAAEHPAAVGVYYETSMLLFDLLWKALAPAMPDRLGAGHYASMCSTFLGGPDPENGEEKGIVETQLGGWGASAECDGAHALYNASHGDMATMSIEICEQLNGVLVERLSLNDEPGGEGAMTGGRGIVLDYRILADDWWVTIVFGRTSIAPWGLEGGLDGSLNFIEIHRNNGEAERLTACTQLPLQAGDLLRVVTANGGGYGDPRGRPHEKIRDDVKNGYIIADHAEAIYGAEWHLPQI